jgi:hypothetical protein
VGAGNGDWRDDRRMMTDEAEQTEERRKDS